MNPIRILTCNVAHGNCHAIWSPSGKLVLIDLGSSDDFSPVAWLKSIKAPCVDVLVLTHPHDDHIRGLRDLGGLPLKVLYCPRAVPSSLTADLDVDLKQAWNTYDANYSSPVQDSSRFYDTKSAAFDGLSLRFFGGKSESANLNNYSLVTVLEYGGFKMVFPGDLESQGWTDLFQNVDFKAAVSGADVLVAAHHGREAGWCSALFDLPLPQLVVISDGAATETSWSSQYSQKAKGAHVRAKNTGETKKRFVVSTRDNGHIDINVSAQNGAASFSVDVDRH